MRAFILHYFYYVDYCWNHLYSILENFVVTTKINHDNQVKMKLQ